MTRNKTLIFIPTYNESENIEKLFLEVKSLSIEADILFLDDNSPDGTGKIIDRIINENSNVFVIHRTGKLGIGSAHKDGIKWAYNNNYTTIITMDCDFTSSPSYIFDFIKYSSNHDVIIGSRFLEKDSLKTWNIFRKLLTHLGHFLTATFLEMPYDSSNSFRLYNLKKIPPGVFELVSSNGYSFFFESLFILNINKYTIYEFPVNLPTRTHGRSKMTVKDAFKSLKCLTLMYKKKVFNRKELIFKDSKIDVK